MSKHFPVIILLILSTLIGLTLTELLLRKFSPISVSRWEADPKYIYRNRPSSRRTYRYPIANGGKWVTIKTNERGWRDHRVKFDPKAYKIAVYGDSFIYAEFSPYEQTLAQQLERKLGGNAQVINLGVVGYGPDQILLRMRDELNELRPDLVIISLFSGNDFGDLMRNNLFRLDASGVLRENKPILSDSVKADLDISLTQPSLHLIRLLYNLKARFKLILSQSAEAKNQRKKNYDFPEAMIGKRLQEARENQAGNQVVSSILGDDYDFDLSVIADPKLSAYKIQVMASIIRLIKEEASRSGTKILFLVLPSIVDACPEYDIQVDTKKFPSYSRRRLVEIEAKILENERIPFVEMFDRLSDPDCSKFWHKDPGNGHWNEKGQEKAVEALLPLIQTLRNGS